MLAGHGPQRPERLDKALDPAAARVGPHTKRTASPTRPIRLSSEVLPDRLHRGPSRHISDRRQRYFLLRPLDEAKSGRRA